MMLPSCEKKHGITDNPFFEEWSDAYGAPPFNRILTEHYEPAFERAFSLYTEQIAQITSNSETPSFENTIEAFDCAGEMFERVYGIFTYICSTSSSKAIREAESILKPKVKLFLSEIYQNEKLFDRISHVYDRRLSMELDSEQRRLTEKIFEKFVEGGALLNNQKRARLRDIEKQCAEIETAIAANILAQDSTYFFEVPLSKTEGLPQKVKDRALLEAKKRGIEDKMVFTFKRSSIFPFLQTAQDRELRKKFYTDYLNRCNHDEWDNRPHIKRLMELRAEKALLLGFPTYSHYRLSQQNEKDPDVILKKVEEIFHFANNKAQQERHEFLSLFLSDNPKCDSLEIASWDWWYYAEKIRKKDYISDEYAQNYFSLENVLMGAFNLLNRLYGLSFRPIAAPIYNSDVRVYEVIENDFKHLGVLYVDPYSRSAKKQGAWCQELVPSRRLNSTNQYRPAVVAVSYNFQEPENKNYPTLLGLREVRTLFHEMGHAVQFLFCKAKYNTLRHTEGDIIEFPSKLMEQWAFEPSILRSYAFHFRNNDVISKVNIEKIQKALLFNQGFDLTELCAAALLDLDLHMLKNYDEFDDEKFQQEVLYGKRKMIPQIEPRYRLPYFAHILKESYASGYYFYLYSEIMAHDMFDAFLDTGDATDKRMSASLRKYLERGGAQDGISLYRNMRGLDADISHMLLRRAMIPKPKEESDEKEVLEESDN